MSTQQETNYNRIAEAIDYINTHYKTQPDLEEVAGKVALSPFHFQRLFTEWAGVSPKKFLQYITVAHAKKMLVDNCATLFDTAIETGLSGTSRLHDLFIGIEGMTPGEYKNGGESLSINYSYAETPFGKILVASTPKGICHIGFADDEVEALKVLKSSFPNASYNQVVDLVQQHALFMFTQDWSKPEHIKLHIQGTPFQLKVWEPLLNMPPGRLTPYGSVARQIQSPNASHAVRTAIGDNPVAFVLPCPRIIQATGTMRDYRWASLGKT